MGEIAAVTPDHSHCPGTPVPGPAPQGASWGGRRSGRDLGLCLLAPGLLSPCPEVSLSSFLPTGCHYSLDHLCQKPELTPKWGAGALSYRPGVGSGRRPFRGASGPAAGGAGREVSCRVSGARTHSLHRPSLPHQLLGAPAPDLGPGSPPSPRGAEDSFALVEPQLG